MQKHHEDIFKIYEQSLDNLLEEAERYSFDIEQDIQAEAWEMRDEDLKKLGIIHNAIKVKTLSEKMDYLETEVALYERAIELEFYEQAGELKRHIDFYVHSFLEEVPAKYLGLPQRVEKDRKKK